MASRLMVLLQYSPMGQLAHCQRLGTMHHLLSADGRTVLNGVIKLFENF